jgi:hypothetical protein
MGGAYEYWRSYPAFLLTLTRNRDIMLLYRTIQIVKSRPMMIDKVYSFEVTDAYAQLY